jgi:RNA polymerase sigma factor (sigma-70 family)
VTAPQPREPAVSSDLVERAQRGDHEAFAALATAAYHRLYAIARRILRDGYAAEDAVQDAIVKAWREIRGLRDPGAFDAWLHRLLVSASAVSGHLRATPIAASARCSANAGSRQRRKAQTSFA